MLFKDIIGNEVVKRKLINSVKNNRTSHTQLFYGNRGSGKLALALAYAQYLNCRDRTEDSCGFCPSCLKYNRLSHPDLHLIFPVLKVGGEKRAVSDHYISEWRSCVLENPYLSLNDWIDTFNKENKTGKKGVIYKDEAIAVHTKLSYKNFESLYRVVLIWMPERMNLEASNMLLKLLEEPPKGTIFLLVADNPNQLLPTISSRLQTIKISDFTTNDIVNYFSSNKMGLEKAKQLRNLTDADLGQIIKLESNPSMKVDFFDDFSMWNRLVYKIDILNISKWSDNIASQGRNYQRLYLSYSIKMFRECLIFNFGNKRLLKTNEKEYTFISKFAPFIHEKNSVAIVEELENAIKALNRNANSKILFFELSLQMAKLLKLKRKFAVK